MCLPRKCTHNFHSHVIINKSELDILSRYTLDYPHIETGGQLFGYWTLDGNPVILFVLGPGPQAGHKNTFFMQDIPYLKECISILRNKYGLEHIGEWHSHHQLGLTKPSGHDANNISTNIRKLGYPRFLLCIATCNNQESMINAYMFYSHKNDYEHIPWEVIEIESPFRSLIQFKESSRIILPICSKANMVNLEMVDIKRKKIEFEDTYWLKKLGNQQKLQTIIEKLSINYPGFEFCPTLDKENEVHIEVYKDQNLVEDIHFPGKFPLIPIKISTSISNNPPSQLEWKVSDNLEDSVIKYYNSYKQLIKL